MKKIKKKNIRIFKKVSSEKKSEQISLGESDIYSKISKIFLFLSVFLIPLFFLPIATTNFLEIGKQILLEILIFTCLFLFLLKKLVFKRFDFKWNFFHLAVIIFIIILGLSTIFSIWPYGSFWGISLNINSSFLSFLLFSLFYFLAVNIFVEKKEIWKAGLLFIISAFLTVIISIFYLFGKFIFPFNFLARNNFNPVGSLTSLGILIAVLFPLLVAFSSFEKKKPIKILLGIIGVVFLFYLFLINARVSWMVLMVGTVFAFSLEMMSPRENKVFGLAIPTFLLVLSLFFVVFRFTLPYFPRIPLEVNITQKVGLAIAKESLKEKPLLGSGPATFFYSFSRFKPDFLNQSVFWNIRLNRGASEFLDRLTTTGILGFLSFLFLIAIFIKIALPNLSFSPSLSWPIFSSFIALITGFLFYPANFVLMFLFWLLISIFLSLLNITKK